MDTSPTWSKDGNTLFFSSDRTGVPNIFACSLSHQTLFQVTNVLTGAFDPAVSPDGTRLAFDLYSGEGMDIHITELNGENREESIVMATEQPATSEKYAGTAQHDIRRYNPLSSLIPRLGPAFDEDAEGYMLGLTLSGKDILEQHKYSLAVLYGLKSEDIAYEVEYINKQFFPTIRLFGYDMPEKYHDLFRNTAEEEEPYFERQQGFGIDIAVPVFRTHLTTVSLLTGYEYQTLSNLTDLAELSEPLPDEGTLSSASAGLLFDRIGDSRYPDEQSGQLLLLKYSRYDESLGSDFTIDEFTGKLDVRLKVPFLRNHLLRLRTAGGLSEGDTLEQGMFQSGGFLVNSPPHALEDTQFYLRGYAENVFTGDRAVVGTAEYRFPIWFPQRTIWGGRFFIDSITGGVFYETGDAWKDDERDLDLKQSVGGELTLNLGAYYGKYPVSLGIGFAKGLDDETGKSQVYFKFGMDM